MSTRNIVFIDGRIADHEALVANLGADTEWFLLDAAQDGVAQMHALLDGHRDLDSIQLVSHGSVGNLYLGSTVLNVDTLGGYRPALQDIGARLGDRGDFLLYGCNVGAGTEGAAFVHALANLTGADVAASSDLTGPAYRGGDGELEITTGAIEAERLSMASLEQTLAVNTAPTFSVPDGKVTTDIGGYEYGYSVLEQPDGKLVVAGTSNGDFALSRYTPEGAPDIDFPGSGKLITDFGGNDSGQTLILQADGKLVIAGHSDGNFAISRYNPDGSLDQSFDEDGRLTTDIGGRDIIYSVTQQSDGKLVAAGSSDENFALSRYNSDGTLDTTFDNDGRLTTEFGRYISSYGQSVIQQADGKLVVAGISSGKFALARYNTDGSLDTSFDGDGMLTTDFGSVVDLGYSLIQQFDGKLVVAGTSFSYDYNDNSGNNFALMRFNVDGTLDTSFDNDGRLTTDFGGTDIGHSVIQQADGKLVVAGESRSDFALARYNSDGTLDISFNGDGKLVTDIGYGSSDGASSVLQQADGKLVVAGGSDNNIALVRYESDGTLDSKFSPPETTLDYNPSFREPEYYDPSYFIRLAPRVQIFDSELAVAGHYGGASLTLSRQGGASQDDVFAGTGTLSILSAGNYFSVDSVTIGRVTTNSGGTLQLSFNSNATQARIDKALQQIGYANTSDAPPAMVQIDWVFDDGNTGSQGTGGALSVTGTSTVTITPTNDAPVLGQALQDQVVLASAAFNYVLPAGAFHDPDLEALQYSVAMHDGSGVPPWLRIDPITGALSGTPDPLDVGSFVIRITARDASGATVSNSFGLTVSAASSTLEGDGGANLLIGEGGDDLLIGYAGNDTLDGGLGQDNMNGGDGSDLYHVRDAGDMVIESDAAAVGGVDTVYSYLAAYTLGAHVENGRLMNPGPADLTGNGLANVLYAGSGDNTLDGQAGVDTVSYAYATGGVFVNLQSTIRQDTESSGHDLLIDIENLTGSKYDDHLSGNAGANVLNGGAGADVMIGRGGNDLYYVDHALDMVVESDAGAAGGTDTVYSSLSAYTLAANVENGRITASATQAANLTGNALSNVLFAGAGHNILHGGTGKEVDTVSYRYGLISGATSGVKVSLATASAQNTGSSGSDTLINIENLIGSSLADTLTGSTGHNILDGGTGADSMYGGLGNDTYYVDNAADYISESSDAVNGGIDTVVSSVTRTLGNYQENLTLSGTAAINGSGNSLANKLVGNNAANVLNGGGGADSMYGGLGNDTYYVDNAADYISESSDAVNGGIDTVISSVTRTLGNYQENLTLSGTAAINGTGNALGNVIKGNAAANILDGKAGADSMYGGLGNDTYYVDNTADYISESSDAVNGGIDTVVSSVTRTLGSYQENLTLSGSAAIDGTGNSLANVLVGNSAANRLAGGSGNDSIGGGSGNDTLEGGSGADTLVGGSGQDTLTGGTGNDLFVFTRSSETATTLPDLITDFARGYDRIDLSLFDGNMATTGTLEDFTFIGTAAFSSNTPGQLRYVYDSAGSVLTLYGSNDADTSAEFAIQILGVTTLSAADFIL